MRESFQPVRVGIIGCGTISAVYCKNIKQFPFLELIGCADIMPERAQARASEFEIPRAYSTGELLDDPDIELVVNLTVPDVHAEISLAALERGKSVYSEKPLATRREDGLQLLRAAEKRGVLLGCAPDTFLGTGLQTCRKLLDDGWIGEPVAASASLQSHGPEHWHPDPSFFYQPGAGPLFDMGPYYLTTLITLLGSVQRVVGFTRKTFVERLVTSPRAPYRKTPVNTPTHIAGLLEFAGGVPATFITSFDIWGSVQPPLEIHGTLGSLRLPDPNTFSGPIWLLRAGEREWSQIPLAYHHALNDRGLGVADLALALRQGRRQRPDGAMAYHVLDIMQSFDESFQQGRYLEIASTCERPAPLALNRRELQQIFDI
ncbi:MAG TPA: Gfo/Idh/MocA family oxidoreductase [Ktedonobacteraceae bacterium]|jgi:predicted dehydrogenase